MSIGLIGFIMFLAAFMLGAKMANDMPTLNLKHMLTGSFLFWNGLLLMSYAALLGFILKITNVFD